VPALRRLLPAGTLLAVRGLPTIVLSRGLLSGAFFAVEAYLPLTLTEVHGSSPTLAGLPLTIGALGWAAASAWQGRHPDYPRHRLLRIGFLLVAASLAGVTLVAFEQVPYWLVLPAWTVGGLGMGMAMPSLSVRLLELSPPSDRGFNSAALQIWDMLMVAGCIGFGGVLLLAIASTAEPTPAVVVLNLLMAGLAVLGAVLAARTRAAAPAPA
jgi:MFS family permease